MSLPYKRCNEQEIEGYCQYAVEHMDEYGDTAESMVGKIQEDMAREGQFAFEENIIDMLTYMLDNKNRC